MSDILTGLFGFNAIQKAEKETWITVKGTHVKIKDGQSKGDAVKEFLAKNGSSKKTDSTYDRAVSKVDAFGKKNRASGKPMVGSKEANKESDARKRKEDDAFISNAFIMIKKIILKKLKVANNVE